jgi:hypothetical protein
MISITLILSLRQERFYFLSLSLARSLFDVFFERRIPTAQQDDEGESDESAAGVSYNLRTNCFTFTAHPFLTKRVLSSSSLLHPRSNFIFISALSFIPTLFLSLSPCGSGAKV